MWIVFVQPRRRGVFGGTMLEVPKELSNSYKEGIEEKLKCMAQSYKMKILMLLKKKSCSQKCILS